MRWRRGADELLPGWDERRRNRDSPIAAGIRKATKKIKKTYSSSAVFRLLITFIFCALGTSAILSVRQPLRRIGQRMALRYFKADDNVKTFRNETPRGYKSSQPTTSSHLRRDEEAIRNRELWEAKFQGITHALNTAKRMLADAENDFNKTAWVAKTTRKRLVEATEENSERVGLLSEMLQKDLQDEERAAERLTAFRDAVKLTEEYLNMFLSGESV